MYVKVNGLITFILVSLHMCLAKLPPSIVPCHRNDPNINRCITREVNKIRPLLAQGNLGDGYRTPPLEPLHIPKLNLGGGDRFHAIFTDMLITGGSRFVIEKLSSNISSLAFDVDLKLPRIDFTSKYFMIFNILVLKLQGQGDAKGYLENAKAFAKIRAKRVLKDGSEFIRLTHFNMKIDVDVFKLHLDNLFNGDRILGAVGNSIIDENPELFLNEVMPGLEKELSKIFVDIANIILEKTTYDEMFPI